MSVLSIALCMLALLPAGLIGLGVLARLQAREKAQSATTGRLKLPDSCAGVVANQLLSTGGNSVFVGGPRSGKSTLFEQLQFRGAVCVVRLALADNIAGWEEAPFFGSFAAGDGAEDEGLDLDDVLRSRPAGTFRLELPAQVLREDSPKATLLRDALCKELERVMQPGYARATGTKLLVLVDAAETVLTDAAVRSLALWDRTANCSVALFRTSLTGLLPEFLVNAPLRGAFGGFASDTSQSEAALQLPPGSFAGMAPEEFWLRNDRWESTLRLSVKEGAQVSPARPAGKVLQF